MSEQTFDDRVAALEEHLVRPTAEDYLARAEEHVARGRYGSARMNLALAQLVRDRRKDDDQGLDDAE